MNTVAEELLFDSEIQEKKAKRRKWLFPLLALAVILVIAVVVALLLRPKKKEAEIYKGGEDTLYPYTWQTGKDGSILLELPHENDPDYRWALSNPDELAVVEAEREKKDRNGATRITLTPKEAGRDIVELILLREEDAASAETAASGKDTGKEAEPTNTQDSIYRLTLLVEFSEEGGSLQGTVLNSSGIRLQGFLTGGADSENPYRIYSENEVYVIAAVRIASLETDWMFEILSGAESITGESIQYAGGEVRLYLRAGEKPGESELLFRSEAAGAELRLRALLQEDGTLLITDHQAQYGEKTVVSPTEDSGIDRGDDSQKGKSDKPKDSDSAETDESEAETAEPQPETENKP